MTNVPKKSSSISFYIFAVICLFCYIYQFNLDFLKLPFFNSSVQVSWVLMLIYAIVISSLRNTHFNIKGFRTYSRWKKHVKYFVILFLYSLFLIIVIGWGDGTNIILEVIKIFIYGILMFWIWREMFGSIDEFLKILLIVSIIQTLVVFYCLYDSTFAFILDQTVNFNPTATHHVVTDLREGYAGGIGCISSHGLIKYALTGLFPCTYFCIKKKGILYLILFIIMAFCAAMIARTGLIFDAIFAIFIIIKRLRSSNLVSVVSLLVVVTVGIFALKSLFSSSTNEDFIEERFYRYEHLKDNRRDSFFELYFHGPDTKYPPINQNTILGVGVTSGTSANGYEVNVDGGPMRQYSAIGLLGCILFYFFVMFNQAKTIALLHNKDSRHLLCLLFLCLFISEWKEITYMALWPLMLFFFISYLLQIEEGRNE